MCITLQYNKNVHTPQQARMLRIKICTQKNRVPVYVFFYFYFCFVSDSEIKKKPGECWAGGGEETKIKYNKRIAYPHRILSSGRKIEKKNRKKQKNESST